MSLMSVHKDNISVVSEMSSTAAGFKAWCIAPYTATTPELPHSL